MSEDILSVETPVSVSLEQVVVPRAPIKIPDDIVKQYDAFLRYAKKITGNAQLAEDVVQDTYVKLAEKMPSLDQTNLKAWMYTTIRNDYISRGRHDTIATKHNRRIAKQLRIKENMQPEDPDFVKDEVSPQLIQAMQKLQTSSQEILKLVADGHTYEQVAAIKQIPIGTVMSRMYRARLELNSYLPTYAKP